MNCLLLLLLSHMVESVRIPPLLLLHYFLCRLLMQNNVDFFGGIYLLYSTCIVAFNVIRIKYSISPKWLPQRSSSSRVSSERFDKAFARILILPGPRLQYPRVIFFRLRWDCGSRMELSSSYFHCLEGLFLRAQSFECICCFGVQRPALQRSDCNMLLESARSKFFIVRE